MMKKLVFFFASLVLLISCKETKEDLITRKWVATGFESASLQQEIAQQRAFLDTIGTTTDAATNERLYGVKNMDSMRTAMKLELDHIVAERELVVRNTWLDFHKDGTLISCFGSDPDTVSWYFDKTGVLVMDEVKKKGSGGIVKMDVLELNDTLLRLQYKENGFSSTANFKPETK